jgi:hypothetical protein
MYVFLAKFNAYCDKFMPKNPHKEPMNTSSERRIFMRIIVMSDSHGDSAAVEKVVSLHPEADIFFHLGDGIGDVNTVLKSHPELEEKFICVKGNCDIGVTAPELRVVPVGNHKIYAAHGHLQEVRITLEYIRNNAIAAGCDIVIYGHNHSRFESHSDGIYIMNPGSVSCPYDGKKTSYGIIDIMDSGIVTNVADL